MTQPEPVGGGSFDVDITRAPQAIRQLEQARDELESIKNDAQLLGQVNPPARDKVSLDAAELLGRKAIGGPGSLIAALDEGIEGITALIDQLRSGFGAYQRSDAEAESLYRQVP